MSSPAPAFGRMLRATAALANSTAHEVLHPAFSRMLRATAALANSTAHEVLHHASRRVLSIPSPIVR